jgi:hypothetical protein
MDIVSILLIIVGLAIFETVSSLDNAVINAQVLSTMSQRARKWFLTYGLLIAVFIIRGVLPFIIIWITNPTIGPITALTSLFTTDPRVNASIEASAPVLLIGGGTFLFFLFFHWLFLEPKQFGLYGERFIQSLGMWFYVVVSVLLAILVWFAFTINPLMAKSALIGAVCFFITNGFNTYAKQREKQLLIGSVRSDMSKLLYLEVIDATFSIDGVFGSFAFTQSVFLILIGNGIGAYFVRELTFRSIDKIQKYQFLKNGAMYSVFVLSCIMIYQSFGHKVPEFIPPLVTIGITLYFFYKSKATLNQ